MNWNEGSFRLSFYISLAALLGCFVLFPFIDISLKHKLLLAGCLWAISFLSSLFLLNLYIYRPLNRVNKQIIDSIKGEKFSRAEGQGALAVFENSVKRLIREKTIEINNLKELERLRKEFLGDVAHELRSPVFNVQGYIHTLMEGAMEDEAVRQKFLEKAAKHTDHLSSLVEDLVTISRIEAGELKLELSDFDICELIKEVIELQDLSARQKSISLHTKFEKAEPIMVKADRQKIRQVLNNLIGNSIKYGRQGGNTVISVTDEKNVITVAVSDNGEGIAEEHLPRLFERFYRVDKSRARNVASTGLGLAIVKHFVEAHKQKVLVTSREGVGSIFSFTLQKAE